MSHQRVEIVAHQGSVVDNVSLEDDKEEEESQHHVTKVTEYVVECTVLGRRKIIINYESGRSLLFKPSSISRFIGCWDTGHTSELPAGGRTGSCSSKCPGFL